MNLRSLLVLIAFCFVPFGANSEEPPRSSPSVDDVVAAQNQLREFAEYYIGRKPSVEDQTRADHAGDKLAAVFKSGVQSSGFVEALVSKMARDLAFSEHENFKQIDSAPFLNLQRLLRDQMKVANQLAIIQTYQQQRIIEQNERLIHLLEQSQTRK